jgi:hypothetical protein
MHLTIIDQAIEAHRPGQRPTIVQALPLSHLAYVEARVEAHQTIKSGRLTGTKALQLALTCRLITIPKEAV